MTRTPVLFSLLLGSLLLSACGAKAGDSCSGSGYLCSSDKEALECRDKVWRALPCKGESGCTESGDTIQCDMRGNDDGDACAASAEGSGMCTANGRAVLECRMGVLVQVKLCSVCTMDSNRVTCQP
jgi:hypothetical protein